MQQKPIEFDFGSRVTVVEMGKAGHPKPVYAGNDVQS